MDDLRESADDRTLIKTGNIIFTISYKEDLIVSEIKGIQIYEGKRINIIKYGDSPKCFGCKGEGHQKKDCPHKDTLCENCNKKGHPKCTYASRLRNANYDEEAGAIPEHDEDYQFENEQQILICQQIKITKQILIAKQMGPRKLCLQVKEVERAQVQMRKI